VTGAGGNRYAEPAGLPIGPQPGYHAGMLDTASTAPEIEAAKPDLAVVGVGSVEQHSAHLPVDTDYLIAARAAPVVAERLGALSLPALPYSVCIEHRGFAGVVALTPDTVRRIAWDIAESVGRWGVRHLAFVTFHGGNFILNPAAREWNMDGRSPKIFWVDFYAGLSDVGQNLHACEVETSIMLHLAPERVHRERAVDFVPSWLREDITVFGMKRLTPTGVWGYPTRGTAEKGRRWFEEGIAKSAAKIARLREGCKKMAD
jgi:creatinine amidohydrolase